MFKHILKNNILKVTGKDYMNRDVYFYVIIDNMVKAEILKKVDKSVNTDLSDYGKILISGFGKVTPEYVRKMLKEKYNYED